MELIDIKKQMVANGTNLNRLAYELAKPQIRKMSLKARCEHINLMNFTYGEVRFTCPKILRQRLGLDFRDILAIGIQYMLMNQSIDIFFEGTLRISRVQKGKVIAAGFLIGSDDDELDRENANDPVMDMAHSTDQGAFSPLCIANSPQWKPAF
jgi:hypothetical protein